MVPLSMHDLKGGFFLIASFGLLAMICAIAALGTIMRPQRWCERQTRLVVWFSSRDPLQSDSRLPSPYFSFLIDTRLVLRWCAPHIRLLIPPPFFKNQPRSSSLATGHCC